MSFFERPPRYRAYLLRFWQESGRPGDPSPVWRFILQEPGTGERRGFADLESMVDFLRRVMGEEQEEQSSE